MKTLKTLKTWAAAVGLVASAGAAQAALVDRGGGLIYDTTRNITWLADMNYALTSGYAATNAGGSASNEIQADGRMGWDAARNWADTLVYGGYDDWRLPALNPADTSCSINYNPGGGFPQQYGGYNCTGGELSGLFVTDLGNKKFQSVLDQTGNTAEQNTNLALFSNVQSDAYWSDTEYAPKPPYVWFFSTNFANQGVTESDLGTLLYAVAVRPGDVPEPQTLTLVLLALGATVVARRRRPR